MIIISARQEEAVKIEGLGLGADDYVAKPFSLDELKARIQSHLRRWQRYQGNLSLMDEQVTTYQGGLVISRSEEHTSELQSRFDLVCRLLLEKKKKYKTSYIDYNRETQA